MTVVMATHVIINPRTREISASLEAPGEGTVFFSVDLINDTWQDYGYFVEAAGIHERKGEHAVRNRYLRAALANLYAHLDGVVTEIYDMLAAQRQIRDDSLNAMCSLKHKMFAIRDYIRDGKMERLPYINLDLKPIPDIINHPSIVKRSRTPGSSSVVFTHVDVYAVAIPDVIEAGEQIHQWLDKACSAVGYERFADTKGWIEKLQAAMNIPKGEIREF